MKIRCKIDNVYDDGTVTKHVEADVPPPPFEELAEYEQSDWVREQVSDARKALLDDWADEHLLDFTGTGRPEGDAGYFLEITACEDDPSLVGVKFEWGI